LRESHAKVVLKMRCTSAILVVLNLVGTLTLHAEPGVFDDRIVFGQSASLKGPAGALGLGMREGILAAFHEANAAGGVHGHRLELISYNDDYEPEVAIAKTNKLIDEDKVFALIWRSGNADFKSRAAYYY
jgi:branched-chain amino acid transport system substrate-binding protein